MKREPKLAAPAFEPGLEERSKEDEENGRDERDVQVGEDEEEQTARDVAGSSARALQNGDGRPDDSTARTRPTMSRLSLRRRWISVSSFMAPPL